MAQRKTALLLDVGYVMKNNASMLRLILKDPETKRTFRLYDEEFEPYFYLKTEGSEEEAGKVTADLLKITAFDRGKEIRIKRVGNITRKLLHEDAKFLKITCFHPSDVTKIREEAKRFGETFEHGISYTKRYVIDKALVPCSLIEFQEGEQHRATGIKQAKATGIAEMPLNIIALDIETYNPRTIPNPASDPAIMVGWADEKEKGIFSFKKKVRDSNAEILQTEKEMLERLGDFLKEKKVDLIATYNGDQFDLPYLRDRAKALRAHMHLGRDKMPPKSKSLGIRSQTSLNGRIHFDVFPVVSFLNYIGAYKLQRLTLEVAYREILGGAKMDVKKEQIWQIWDSDDTDKLRHLAEYCENDAVAAFRLANHVLPLEIELSRLTGMTLFDASRSTPGQLVEMLLMREAHVSGEMILSKPKYDEVQKRSANPVEGAFVKLPSPGVYENIAVLDFRSLYPSIIISHNIDVSTLNCKCCTKEESFVSPQGHRFCKKKKGLMPRVLQNVLNSRFEIKRKMSLLKKDGNAGTPEYKEMDARQWALKIVANSMYGYLLYARSRYYSREAGESVTAYARGYIQKTMEKASEFGMDVLYGDTDSIFMLYGKPENEGRVIEFQKKINSELPETMELELEDIYPRGIFVSKKQEEKGAKKKYALINKEGKIKIRGFELVRRDWSKIAKDTQRQVLEIILKEGDVKKATDLARAKIDELKSGKVPLDELSIFTQLKKAVGSYDIVSPEVSAVVKARKSGFAMEDNPVISYVITKQGKTISEKATITEMAKDYDPDYYINNQVLPAVLKILSALGYDAENLKMKGEQKSLGDW
ncbi:MAG: DNA-directed DNA polymerase [Candidatus Micrarchaeota archaeon]